MKVLNINNLDFDNLMKILTSKKISEVQKNHFIKQNKLHIEKILKHEITSNDFKTLMQNRSLKKFQPLKNSFKKRVDKILLAKALNIKPNEVSEYITNITEGLKGVSNLGFLPPDKIEMIKTYIYRHGTKEEIVIFLDYELMKSKDMVKTLYKTLEYYSGGIADYFIRPIHRMDNKTLINVFNVIDKNIKQLQNEGKFTEAESKKHAKYALIRIYQIQNNSKLINAIKTYNELK